MAYQQALADYWRWGRQRGGEKKARRGWRESERRRQSRVELGLINVCGKTLNLKVCKL